MRPVEPGARKQFHRAAVEARVHTVAVEFDFVEPGQAFRRRVDEAGELRPDPSRQGGGRSSLCYGSRHAGSTKRLRCRRSRFEICA